MIKAWIDGACEPVNPGGTASYGLIIKRETSYLKQDYKIVGEGKLMSNNVAEYSALIAFLEWYLSNIKNNEKTIIYSDSNLVVNQMMGNWKVHKGLYVEHYKKADKIMLSNDLYKVISFKWIPREKNEEADLLSRLAILERPA